MTKKEKLKMIVDKVLTKVQQDNMIIQMLRPILTNFIAQMKDDDIDKMITIIKAIVKYLEKDENKGVKQDAQENKEAVINTR